MTNEIIQAAACVVAVLLLAGCHKVSSAETSPAPAESKPQAPEAAHESLTLQPDEIEKMGIVTTEARAVTSTPEVSGFGVVLAHETVAQPVAELRTAIAALHQSHAAFERTHRLSGTPGAMPAETQETAERQATADQAALELARQRLSSTFGLSPPWKDAANSPEVQALASGRMKLVRATFPLGSLGNATPTGLRLARMDVLQGSGKSWRSDSVWVAPADAAVPGRSYFAILKDSEASEGEHVLVWAPVGAPESGVLIPASAALISGGKFWFYVEETPDTFVRRELDPSRPVEEGYFMKEGVSPGQKIVTTAAGQLLARETNPSTEAE